MDASWLDKSLTNIVQVHYPYLEICRNINLGYSISWGGGFDQRLELVSGGQMASTRVCVKVCLGTDVVTVGSPDMVDVLRTGEQGHDEDHGNG